MDTILTLVKKMEEKTLINSFTSDLGSEFNNSKFKSICEKENISTYYVNDDCHKLDILNRFHRTIKEKLQKYFISYNTVKWYDVIYDEIVNNHNHTVNRGIGYEPIKVNSFIQNSIVQDKKQQTIKIQNNNINDLIGKHIRILNDKSLFEDIMIPRYSNTLFTVLTKETKNNVLATDNKYEYKVKKSNIKIVDGVNNILLFTAQKEANKSHQIERFRS